MKIKKLSFFLIAITALTLLIAATGLCASAEEIAYPIEGGNLYFDPETGTITGADNGVRDLNIPAEINGVKVTAIGDSAFEAYNDIYGDIYIGNAFNSVTFPDTLTSIGDSAFYGVKWLKSVTIPGNVKTIGNEAFRQCSDLKELVISVGVEEIGEFAFSQCYALKTATIGATMICPEAFSGNWSLDSLTLLEGVEIIATYAFSDIRITELTVPSSVRMIDDNAFEACIKLVSLTLNEGLEIIGDYAFADTEIAWVDIPSSVVSIASNAFAYTPYEDAPNSCFNHVWSDWTITDAATCIEKGTEIRSCSVCGASETQTIPATGVHVYGEWVDVLKPTCVNIGMQKRNCVICTATQTETIPATGEHSFGEWIVTTEPTCVLKGEESRKCDNCDATETRTIHATDEHLLGEWSVNIEPTVFANGEEIRKCGNCDYSEAREIAKLDMTNPFVDIKDGKWYTDGVLYCYHKGYMAGVSEDTFGYKQNVTRAMFVTILAKIDGADTSDYSEMSFADVKAGQWYSNAIEWAYRKGYAAGIGDGVFGYKQNVSREQLAMFFYTYSEKNGVDVSRREDISKFTDADRIHDYALDAVKWAVHCDLISGTSDTTLSPRDSATRAEIALIVMNYVENVKVPTV